MKPQDKITLGQHEFTVESIVVLNNISNHTSDPAEHRLILQVEVARKIGETDD